MSKAPPSALAEVRSRLLPLPRWEQCLEVLFECLPRDWIPSILRPEQDVELISDRSGEYRVTGDAPVLVLEPLDCYRQGGWFYLEAALERHTGCRRASLGVWVSGTMLEIPISSNLRGTIREVFHLPAGVQRLEWRPMTVKGMFRQTPFLLHRISWLESVGRRLLRVVFDLYRFHGLPWKKKGANLMVWGRALVRLEVSYMAFARTRMLRAGSKTYRDFVKNEVLPQPEAVSAVAADFSFALILNVDAEGAHYLERTLDSLRHQTWPHWQLYIQKGQGCSAQVWCDVHARIQQSEWLQPHLAGVWPAGLTLGALSDTVEAHCIGVLDVGDELRPCTLALCASHWIREPALLWVYGDHDELDVLGERGRPHFKPDWNPDLYWSCDYIRQPAFFARAAWADLPASARSWPLTSRSLGLALAMGRVSAAQIAHIPCVLAHSRVFPTRSEVRLRAEFTLLQRALEPVGAEVCEEAVYGGYWVTHPLPQCLPLVSVLIPTRDALPVLRQCVDSLLSTTTYPRLEMIVVDNQSADPDTLTWLAEQETTGRIRVVRLDIPFNYALIHNLAVKEARGEVLALLNNDIEIVDADWLEHAVRHVMRDGVGAVGAKLLYPDGAVQHAGVVTGIGGIAGHVHKYLGGDEPGYCNRAVLTQNFSAVTGACMVMCKSHYQQVGGMDENLAVAFNDVDLCLKLGDAGLRMVYEPRVRLIHHESYSRGADDTPAKQRIFRREYDYMKMKWGKRLVHDPAYNPNLTLNFEDFSVR